MQKLIKGDNNHKEKVEVEEDDPPNEFFDTEHVT